MVSIRILYHKNTQRVPPTGLTFSNYRSLFAGSAAQRSIAPTPTCFPIPGQVIAHRAHKTRAAKRRNTQNKNNNCPHVVSTLLLYIRGLENQKKQNQNETFFKEARKPPGASTGTTQTSHEFYTSAKRQKNDTKILQRRGKPHFFFFQSQRVYSRCRPFDYPPPPALRSASPLPPSLRTSQRTTQENHNTRKPTNGKKRYGKPRMW